MKALEEKGGARDGEDEVEAGNRAWEVGQEVSLFLDFGVLFLFLFLGGWGGGRDRGWDWDGLGWFGGF